MRKKIEELIVKLNKAAKEYYQKDNEIITNYEYDKLYDKLVEYEIASGIVLSNSPTQRAGYEVLSKLKKVTHESKMLSLNKTKEESKLQSFLGNHEGVLSWKLDGLTIVLTYLEGLLTKAVTRGNGIIGEDVTHNVKVMSNVPLRIPVMGKVVLRGEAVIAYDEFKKINAGLTDREPYKNPRNLCSGTVRQLKTEICAERNVKWIAFGVLNGFDEILLQSKRFEKLVALGFEVVEHRIVNPGELSNAISEYTGIVSNGDETVPLDGLVLTYNNIEYANSLGVTSHHPKHSMAFKWADDSEETTLRDILVDIGKQGQVSYTGVFDPVEIEGTTVTKATLHNYDNIKNLEIGLGDSIEVIKANMIIPQIVENNTRSGTYKKATECPFCSTKLEHDGVHQYCTNYDCNRQVTGRLDHWGSRDAMNIEGISEDTIQAIRNNAINIMSVDELYSLHNWSAELNSIERFGVRKVDKILGAIELSKTKPLNNVLYGLAVPQLGRKASLILAEHYLSIKKLLEVRNVREIQNLVGNVVGEAIFLGLIINPAMKNLLRNLEKQGVNMTQPVVETTDKLAGKTFVVTGKVSHFANRDEVKTHIAKLGGSNGSSVTAKTDFLINNDIESTSGKNKKAKDLGIPIITEDQFLEMC